MKKIIKGKVYDTANAEYICSISEQPRGRGMDDFHLVIAELYQTKKGSFFIFGFGGAATRFKKSVQSNNWVGSHDLIPITIEDAQGYCEKFSQDNVEIFFDVEEA